MSAELQSPRTQIDEIDRQLVQLVAERMAVVRAIASTKKTKEACRWASLPWSNSNTGSDYL